MWMGLRVREENPRHLPGGSMAAVRPWARDLCKDRGRAGLGEGPLLTAASCGWCRDAAGPAPRRSGGWDQPGAPAVARRRQRAPHGRLHAEGPSPPVPDRGQPDDAGGAAGRRCGPGWQRCTAVCSAPACIPATTALQGRGRCVRVA